MIKWILPPGLRSTMAPELMDESDREYRPCLNPSSRGRLMGSGFGPLADCQQAGDKLLVTGCLSQVTLGSQ